MTTSIRTTSKAAPDQQPTISVGQAAELLADKLGGSTQQWAEWLKNDRRPGRANHIPVVPGPGRPRYHLHKIEQYITDQGGIVRPLLDVPDFSAGEMGLAGLLRDAVMLDDSQLRDELAAARLDGPHADLVAFEVMSGLDQHGQPTIWVRSGLRNAMHLAITLPFTADEVRGKVGAA